jgi:hypothetical protein
MELGGLAAADGFDELRLEFVGQIEEARSAESEEALASVLANIVEAAEGDLRQQSESGESQHELVAAVNAWASVLSYATARFYFEGPESLLKRGGYSKGVVSRLEDAVTTFRSYLEAAIGTTGASSFSISIGFPLGVSVGLEWSV